MAEPTGRQHAERGNTREKIVAAAARVLGERGYEATTVKAIARAAGVAPGLVHYYFEGKEALLVAVLHEAAERHLAETAARRASLAPQELLAAALADRKRRVADEPEWYRLRYEFFALGLRNPALMPGVARLLASGREGIGGVVERVAGGVRPDREALAAVLLGALDGLALQKLADPAFDLDAAFAAVAQLVECIAGPTE